jgi:hypothetical protein
MSDDGTELGHLPIFVPGPLDRQPLVEGGVEVVEILEQRPGQPLDPDGERRSVIPGDECLKSGEIRFDLGRGKSDVMPVDGEWRGCAIGKWAQFMETLPKACAGLIFAALAPEQRHKPLPGNGDVEIERQIGKQSPGLAAKGRQIAAVRPLQLEGADQIKDVHASVDIANLAGTASHSMHAMLAKQKLYPYTTGRYPWMQSAMPSREIYNRLSLFRLEEMDCSFGRWVKI